MRKGDIWHGRRNADVSAQNRKSPVFSPQGCTANGSVNLTYDEYEVIRVLDFPKMTQEECAVKMDISRPTVTRIYDTPDRK